MLEKLKNVENIKSDFGKKIQPRPSESMKVQGLKKFKPNGSL